LLTINMGERPNVILGSDSAQILENGFRDQIEGFGVRIYQVKFY